MTTSKPSAFSSKKGWDTWLAENHALSKGLKLLIAKKGAEAKTVTYSEAVEVALIWGWIDGKKDAYDASAWVQSFTPRTAKSPWSRINRDKALALMNEGALKPPGLAEVERAQKDGRWAAAYEPATTATIPPDLAAALRENPAAQAFFETLDGANRYAILYRVQAAAAKPETRAARVARLVAMLARKETIHPKRVRASSSLAGR